MISSEYYLFSPRGAFCRDLRLLFSSICRLQNNDRVAGNWVGYLGIYLGIWVLIWVFGYWSIWPGITSKSNLSSAEKDGGIRCTEWC